MKPDLNALKFGRKPLDHFISFKYFKSEVRPEILEIPEILKSGVQAPKE